MSLQIRCPTQECARYQNQNQIQDYVVVKLGEHAAPPPPHDFHTSFLLVEQDHLKYNILVFNKKKIHLCTTNIYYSRHDEAVENKLLAQINHSNQCL